MMVSAINVATESPMLGLPSRFREARGQVVLVNASAMASLCVREQVIDVGVRC